MLPKYQLSYETTMPKLRISNEVRIFTVPDLCSKGVKTMLIVVSVLRWVLGGEHRPVRTHVDTINRGLPVCGEELM